MATVGISPQEGVGFLAATNTGGANGRKATQQAIQRLMELRRESSDGSHGGD
jgi:hypothetical protein